MLRFRSRLSLAALLLLTLSCQAAPPASQPPAAGGVPAPAGAQAADPLAQALRERRAAYPVQAIAPGMGQADVGLVSADAGLLAPDRRLFGLGFRDFARIAKVRLTAEGPGISPAIATTVAHTFAAPAAGAPLAPPPRLSLAVPVGKNRLFTLQALDAAGRPVATFRSIGEVKPEATLNLLFDPATDAAGRVLEGLLFAVATTQPGNALVASLASADLTLPLLTYVTRLVGYNATTNRFSGVDPLYMPDLALARLLAADGNANRLSDTVTPFPAALLVEGGATLRVRVRDIHGNALTTGVTVDLLDPVPGHVPLIAPNQGTEYVFTRVPQGGWRVLVTAGGSTTSAAVGVTDGAEVVVVTDLAIGAPTPAPTPVATPSPVPSGTILVATVTTYVGSYFNETLRRPVGLAFDAAGNIFVADVQDHAIHKVSPGGTAVTTFVGERLASGHADGTGAAARFNSPHGVILASDGTLYIADTGNHCIRKATPAGVVTTLAGSPGVAGFANGVGGAARFDRPIGLALDDAGNLYVTDTSNHCVRKVAPDGAVTTFAGSPGLADYADGTGTAARFSFPVGLARDASGNLYIAEDGNLRLRKVSSTGVVSTLAGSGIKGTQGMTATPVPIVDGQGTAANFSALLGVAVDGAGNVFVGDRGVVRKVTPSGFVSTVAGGGCSGLPIPFADGVGSAACFQNSLGVTVDGAGNVYVADRFNNTIRKVSFAPPATPTPSPSPTPSAPIVTGVVTTHLQGFEQPTDVAVDGAGNRYVVATGTSGSRVHKVTPSGDISFFSGFSQGHGLTVDGTGRVYLSENHRIRTISPTGEVATLAGSTTEGFVDASGTSARFASPRGLAVDGAGNVYVADSLNNRIRKVTPAGVVSTLAGGTKGYADGTGSAARFNGPRDVELDAAGNLYVADGGTNGVRKITPAGVVTTLAAGNFYVAGETGPGIYSPVAVGVDSTGNVYAMDILHVVQRVTPTGQVSIVAGTALERGYVDAAGAAARFDSALGLDVDAAGRVYVADFGNDVIRRITF